MAARAALLMPRRTELHIEEDRYPSLARIVRDGPHRQIRLEKFQRPGQGARSASDVATSVSQAETRGDSSQVRAGQWNCQVPCRQTASPPIMCQLKRLARFGASGNW